MGTALSLNVVEKSLVQQEPTFSRLLQASGVPVGRLIQTVLISCERTPKLLECTQPSILTAACSAAITGLEVDGVTGQGFLVPMWNNRKAVREAQFWIGYMGYNTLADRAGRSVNADIIREGDEYELIEGSEFRLYHKPKLDGAPDRRILGAYAVGTAIDRPPIGVWVPIAEIVEIATRKAEQNAKEGGDGFNVWKDPKIGFPAMAKKTARRRLKSAMPHNTRTLPYLRAAALDTATEELGQRAFFRPDGALIVEGDEQKGDPTTPKLELQGFPIFNSIGERIGSPPTVDRWRDSMIRALQQAPNDKFLPFWHANADVLAKVAAMNSKAAIEVTAVYDDQAAIRNLKVT